MLIDYSEKFLTAAQNKDTSTMKSLFAPNAIAEIGEQTFDKMMTDFLAYYQGNYVEVSYKTGFQGEELNEKGKKWKYILAPLEIMTDVCEYRFTTKCYIYDDFDENNIGIWSMYIIERDKEPDLDRPYRGDNEYRTGIHIDVTRPD